MARHGLFRSAGHDLGPPSPYVDSAGELGFHGSVPLMMEDWFLEGVFEATRDTPAGFLVGRKARVHRD